MGYKIDLGWNLNDTPRIIEPYWKYICICGDGRTADGCYRNTQYNSHLQFSLHKQRRKLDPLFIKSHFRNYMRLGSVS